MLWFWKCSRTRCHGGRSRTLSGAYDAALDHIRDEHAPIVQLTAVGLRPGMFPVWRVWRVTLAGNPLGCISEFPGLNGPVYAFVYHDGRHWVTYYKVLEMQFSMIEAVHELLEMNDLNINWFTSMGGRIQVDGGAREALAGDPHGAPGPGEARTE